MLLCYKPALMKKIPLLLLLLLTILPTSYAQLNIDSIYQKGATWTEYGSYVVSLGSSKTCRGARGMAYSIGDDTVVGGTQYHKLYKRDLGGYDNCNGVIPEATVSEYIARIRVANRKVYLTRDAFVLYTLYNLGQETLIYDFGVKIGDTVPPFYSSPAYVNNIDTVTLINGTRILKYNLVMNGKPAGYRLEGIGYMFSGSLEHIPGWGSSYPLCYDAPNFSYRFSVTDTTVWGTLLNNCWDMAALNVKQAVNAVANEVRVYPNPVQGDELFIKHEGTVVTKCMVYDVTGKMLYSFTDLDNINENIKLHIPLPRGLYILRIELFNGQAQVRKIIKN